MASYGMAKVSDIFNFNKFHVGLWPQTCTQLLCSSGLEPVVKHNNMAASIGRKLLTS